MKNRFPDNSRPTEAEQKEFDEREANEAKESARRQREAKAMEKRRTELHGLFTTRSVSLTWSGTDDQWELTFDSLDDEAVRRIARAIDCFEGDGRLTEQEQIRRAFVLRERARQKDRTREGNQ